MLRPPDMRTAALLVWCLVLAHAAVAADPYPASQWRYRSHVRLHNTSGTENLADFPILVSLNASNFDFAKAKPDGSDLRFTDRDGTVLSYEIEQYDSIGQQARIWVKVPQVDQASGVDYVNVYYGNPGASDAQNPADVWSNGYKGVWHMSGTGTAHGSPEPDSTGLHPGALVISGSNTITSVAGQIGLARQFGNTTSAGSRIEVAHHDDLDVGNDITVSYWMNATISQPTGYTRTISKNHGDELAGWETQRGGADAHQYVRIDIDPSNYNIVRNIGNNAFDGTWRFNAFTISSGTLRGFLDGTSSTYSYTHGTGFGNTHPLVFGSNITGGNPYNGLIDEVRFSGVARSPAWMNAEYRAQSGQLVAVTGWEDRQLGDTLTARFSHESTTNPLVDDTGHGYDAVNLGGTTFVAPPGIVGTFPLGNTVGQYTRTGNTGLDVPQVYNPPDEDFTFIAFVRKNNDETLGHQTILSTNRFRFQFQNSGTTSDGKGYLRLDVNGAGAGGSAFGAPDKFRVDQWYFAALTYNATTHQIQGYLQPDSPVFFSADLNRTINGSNYLNDMNRFRIGTDGISLIGGGDPFGGWIDDARFYRDYYTKAQLRDLFRSLTGYGPAGLMAQYDHDGAEPLADDTGHWANLTNADGVTFVTPPGAAGLNLGSQVGQYNRAANSYLVVPPMYTPGDDFSFTAMIRKDGTETGSHETILSSQAFRFQFRNTGNFEDGLGTLRLDIKGGPTGESGDGTLRTNEWYFVAMRYDASTGKLDAFLQETDKLLMSGPDFSLSGVNLSGMVNFRLGMDGLSGVGSSDGWGGWIDGARFYDTFLDDATLQAIYNVYRPLPEPNACALMLLGLGAVPLMRWLRRPKQAPRPGA